MLKKQKYAPPQQDFEKYVLEKVDGSSRLKKSSMKNILVSPLYVYDNGHIELGTVDPIELPFKIRFVEREFDRIHLLQGGGAILIPVGESGALELGDYFASEASGPLSPIPARSLVIKGTFGSPGVVLLPWFSQLLPIDNVDPIVSLTLPDPEKPKKIGEDIPDEDPDYVPTNYNNNEIISISRGLAPWPKSWIPGESPLSYCVTNSPGKGRVAVFRWSCLNSRRPTAHITFELRIYENGLIDFVYYPVVSLLQTGEIVSNPAEEKAACGIFVNDDIDIGWRFRDFSPPHHPSNLNLERPEIPRCGYEYIESVFADDFISGVSQFQLPYVNSLQVGKNTSAIDADLVNNGNQIFTGRGSTWPNTRSESTLRFHPPQNLKKTLPKIEVSSYNDYINPLNEQFLPAFDDRKSVAFVSGDNISFPTTFQTGGRNTKPEFYSGFLLQSDSVKSSLEGWITPDIETGDSTGFVDNESVTGDDLHVVNFSLKNVTPLQFPPTSSAIFYYNVLSQGFKVPSKANGVADIVIDPTVYVDKTGNTVGNTWPEDHRGFGPIGNHVVSGSDSGDPLGDKFSSDWYNRFGLGSDVLTGSLLSSVNMSQRIGALTGDYEKTLQVNEGGYFPVSSEVFNPSLNKPFLIQKIKIELPFKAGESWFEDRTKCSLPIGKSETDSIDVGYQVFAGNFSGPGITVSLQSLQSENDDPDWLVLQNAGSNIDLISSAVISPELDNKNITVKQTITEMNSVLHDLFVIENEGIESFTNNTNIVYVSPDINNQFTGSLSFEMSLGIVPRLVYNTNFIVRETHENARTTLTSEYLSSIQTRSVSPIGRNMKGVSLSRGIDNNLITLPLKNQIKNPFYIGDNIFENPSLEAITDPANTPDARFIFNSVVVEESLNESNGYIVKPSDKLFLTVSKMRPTIDSNGITSITEEPIDIFRHGLEHDASIPQGDIKITLIGKHIESGEQVNIIDNNRVSALDVDFGVGNQTHDQINSEYHDVFLGTYTDRVIIDYADPWVYNNKFPGYNFTRRNLFRRIDRKGTFASLPIPLQNKSFFLRLTETQTIVPAFPSGEAVSGYYSNIQLNVPLFNDSEILYDSLTPKLTDYFEIDGNVIPVVPEEEIFFPGDGGRNPRPDKTWGVVFLDMPNQPIIASFDPNASDYDKSFLQFAGAHNNRDWSWSFPYEGKYNSLTRYTSQPDLNASIISPHTFLDDDIFNIHSETSAGWFNLVDEPAQMSPLLWGEPQKITQLMVARWVPKESTGLIPAGVFDLISDCDIVVKANALTGSLQSSELTKVFFGFGDVSTYQKFGDNHSGHNKQPLFVQNDNIDTQGTPGVTRSYSYCPIIRGWKYGLAGGSPISSKCVMRRDRYGQFRDMIEQRQYTKYVSITPNGSFISDPPVTVKFFSNGVPADPEETGSNNISFEVTSSVPYFDGISRSRNYS